MKRSFLLVGVLCLLVPFAFWGCSGDDGTTGATGATGPPGPPGADGTDGTDLTAAPQPESCNVCHGVGQIRDVTEVHAVTWVPLVSGVQTALQPDNTLLISFNVVTTTTQNSDKVPFIQRTPDNVSGYVNIDNAALPDVPLQVTKFQRISVTGTLAAAATAGNYTITVPANRVFDNASYVFRFNEDTLGPFFNVLGVQREVRPAVTVDYKGRHLRNLVTSGSAANPVGCAFCHGPYPAYSQNFAHYAVGGADCQICHQTNQGGLSTTQRDTERRTLLDNGSIESETTGRGANLTEYVHGIHNSHNMPGGTYYRSDPPPGFDADDLSTEERYSVGYPSDMRNCNVCHYSEAQREAAASAPVSYYLCMTCHQNWDGFTYAVDNPRTPGPADPGTPIFTPATDGIGHLGMDNNTTCATANCHLRDLSSTVTATRDEAADFHDSFQTTDIHLDSFYRGEDISFNNDDNVVFAITGVQKSGDNVAFTWTASRLGVAVNPCDNNLNTGPSFRGLAAQLAYAKGDDWVNENLPGQTSPGQPASSKNLFTSLSTTCDNTNVATTRGLTVAASANAYASKATLALLGKPINRGTFLIGSTNQQRDYLVRSPSRTFDFSMADGSAATARRPAVDSDKCNRCHRGTLYQHGGERVDNEQLCVICHNPSSSEKNVRAATYRILNSDNTVNTSKTYDGKVAETYDMRYMIHAIHGAEKREKPIIIYRGRGIFAFAEPVYETISRPTATNPNAKVRVSVEHPRPTGWPAIEGEENPKQPVYGSLNDNVQFHTWTTVHYPKPFNECIACHTGNEFFDPADQTKAVALTVDPGTSYSSQTDDIVIGPSAAACTGCHESTGPDGIPVQRHVTYDFGYKANVAKEVMLQKAQAVSLSPVLSEAVAGP